MGITRKRNITAPLEIIIYTTRSERKKIEGVHLILTSPKCRHLSWQLNKQKILKWEPALLYTLNLRRFPMSYFPLFLPRLLIIWIHLNKNSHLTYLVALTISSVHPIIFLVHCHNMIKGALKFSSNGHANVLHDNMLYMQREHSQAEQCFYDTQQLIGQEPKLSQGSISQNYYASVHYYCKGKWFQLHIGSQRQRSRHILLISHSITQQCIESSVEKSRELNTDNLFKVVNWGEKITIVRTTGKGD